MPIKIPALIGIEWQLWVLIGIGIKATIVVDIDLHYVMIQEVLILPVPYRHFSQPAAKQDSEWTNKGVYHRSER